MYKKSYWVILLDWLVANIKVVVGSAGALMLASLCACAFLGLAKSRRKRVSDEQEARVAYLHDLRASLGYSEKRRRTRVALLRYLKTEIFKRAAARVKPSKLHLSKAPFRSGSMHSFGVSDPETPVVAVSPRKPRTKPDLVAAKLLSKQSRSNVHHIMRGLKPDTNLVSTSSGPDTGPDTDEEEEEEQHAQWKPRKFPTRKIR